MKSRAFRIFSPFPDGSGRNIRIRQSDARYFDTTPTTSIIDGLFRQTLFAALILLAILPLNDIALYRQKLSDRLSLMLLRSVCMCAFEILWEFCSGAPALRALTCLGACGCAIQILLQGAEQFNDLTMLCLEYKGKEATNHDN